MSGNRPDLHTSQHDQWDQGGYCNNLVIDDDGSGTVCGYRAPSDHTPSVNCFREFYAVESDGAISLDEARAEFDRMIEAVRAEEREKAAQIAEKTETTEWFGLNAKMRAADRIRNQEAGE